MSAPVVVGYVRVSGAAQLDGHGLDVQRERIDAFCKYQQLALTCIEADEGISGASTDNRPAFKRAMRRVLEAGAGAILVVYKLDRLGRNALDVQETLAVLLDSGVRVVALSDGVDSASGMGAAMLRLLTNILAAFAELEKETITTRLQDGRRRAKAHGRAYSRESCYGLTDEHEQRIIARIRELHAQPNMSIRAICTQLESEGMHPRHGTSWSPAVVHRLATGVRKPTKKKSSQRITRARAELLSTDSITEAAAT